MFIKDNTIANTFIGGNASSSVGLGGRRTALLHSPVSVTAETAAANLVTQQGSIVDEYRNRFSFSVSDSMDVYFRR